MAYMVPVGVSNKHLHLCQADMDTLFGKGSELHPTKPLKQPKQFASEEKVDLIGPKGTIKGLRVLGPIRPETQIELAQTDARVLGLKLPVRLSGELEGTPGCKLVGPCGEVDLDHGAIIAMRHLHLTDEQAAECGVHDGQIVSIKVPGERGLVFNNVIVRAGIKHEKEVHLDTDEANAAGIGNDAEVEVIID